jgi:beta-lactamase superfamily II metal-dependent hydrolase
MRIWSMNRPSVVILDVGHGNAAVLFDREGVVVVDGGRSGVLIDFLRQLKVKVVSALLISHADEDHILNASDVLLDKHIGVGAVYYNSDASQQSRAWRAFRKAIKEARRNKHTLATPQLTTSLGTTLKYGVVTCEVLYPYPETAASGPGGEDEEGCPVTSNSMSAVIRLSTRRGKMVMLAGDVEPGCLAAWEDEGEDPTAHVLVYPHHGGNPGRHDAASFAVRLMRAVKPRAVIFSIHRDLHGLPRPEVIAAVRKIASRARIACTQLSSHCARAVPAAAPRHLNDYESAGGPMNACCAGTIVIDLSGDAPVVKPGTRAHRDFIRGLSGQPLCLS